MQAQQEGRHELAKHRYRQILEGPLLRHFIRQQRQQQGTATRRNPANAAADAVAAKAAAGTGALAGEELLRKMQYLAMKNMAEVLQLEGRVREAGEAFAAATGMCAVPNRSGPQELAAPD